MMKKAGVEVAFTFEAPANSLSLAPKALQNPQQTKTDIFDERDDMEGSAIGSEA